MGLWQGFWGGLAGLGDPGLGEGNPVGISKAGTGGDTLR